MSNHTGLSPKSPIKYTGPNVYLALVVTRNREPTGADYRQPETGNLYPFNSFWLVGKDPTTGVQGDLWYLSKIVANVAYWVKVSTSSAGPLLNVVVDANTAPGTNPVVADGAGEMTITGGQVAAGLIGANVIRTNSLAANTFTIEIQRSAAVASTASLNNGVSHFNSAQFTVDTNGFVSLIGGSAAMDSLGVQATSGAGTNPVLPDGTGKIEIQGALVAAGSNPLRSVSTAANTLQMQVQTAQALAATDSTKVGLANFDSSFFLVDANGFVSTTKASNIGVSNLGFANTAGTTFTVQSASGAALSATNPAYVTLQLLSTPGRLKTYTITANQSCTQTDLGATSFGLTNGVVMTNNTPIFVYAVSNAAAGENTVKFFLSRYPNTKISPVAGSIGKAGSIVANTQGAFFALDSTITVADYASSPCLCVGSLRFTRSVGNAITFTTLDISDGVGNFNDGRTFAWDVGQFGAAAGTYWYANTGTAPVFSDVGVGYWVTRDNQLQITTKFINCGTAGVGAVTLQLAMPFSVDGDCIGSSRVINAAGLIFTGSSSIQPAGPSNKLITYVVNDASSVLLLNNQVTIAAGYQLAYFARSIINFA